MFLLDLDHDRDDERKRIVATTTEEKNNTSKHHHPQIYTVISTFNISTPFIIISSSVYSL
jgi:hypothetical protein